MQILQKLKQKRENNWDHSGVTIGFLGDSVTQGCFEIYLKENNEIETYFDQSSTYHGYVAKILSGLYPNVPINIINAGISGSNAVHGAQRMEKEILRHQPDLCVVCFGLNDVMNGMEGIPAYKKGLQTIFEKLAEAGTETIFMTPNMINTYVSVQLKEELFRNIAKDTAATQTQGIMDAYMNAAAEVCKACNVTVCDCYGKWKTLAEAGVDTTGLLANHINHPTRDMNWLFAVSLVETMFQ